MSFSAQDRLLWTQKSLFKVIEDKSTNKDNSQLKPQSASVAPNQVSSEYANQTDAQRLAETVGPGVGVITYGNTEPGTPVITNVRYIDVHNIQIRITGTNFNVLPLDPLAVFIGDMDNVAYHELFVGFVNIVSPTEIIVSRFIFARAQQIRMVVRSASIMSIPYYFNVEARRV